MLGRQRVIVGLRLSPRSWSFSDRLARRRTAVVSSSGDRRLPCYGAATRLGTEVLVGPANGLDQECVVSCDNVTTVDRSNLGRLVGYFFTSQEDALRDALIYAYGLLGSHPDSG
jgi:mRNA-degrading endonuclease toxin of MazEF toxin-antitoxin module